MRKRTKSAAKWILIGGILAVIIAVATQLVLPAIFGVSLTGMLAAVKNKLGALGGIFGGAFGFMAEEISHFTTFILNPLMSGNLWAIIGASGVLALSLVVVANIFTYKQVWR